jgi:hypothetical protein
MVQRIIPNDPDAGGHLGLRGRLRRADFAYATPHGGIESAVGGDIFDTAWSIPKKATRICVTFCSATCGSGSN